MGRCWQPIYTEYKEDANSNLELVENYSFDSLDSIEDDFKRIMQERQTAVGKKIIIDRTYEQVDPHTKIVLFTGAIWVFEGETDQRRSELEYSEE